MIISKRKKVLVFTGSHLPIHYGEVASTFLNGKTVTVIGGEPPKHAASTGRVVLRESGNQAPHEYYPAVIGAKWVSEETLDAHQQGRASHDPD